MSKNDYLEYLECLMKSQDILSARDGAGEWVKTAMYMMFEGMDKEPELDPKPPEDDYLDRIGYDNR